MDEPTAWSTTTAWRALEDLRRHGFAHRERADNPARRATANGGPGYAYALTDRKGVRAGALAAGEPVGGREEFKKARGKYMRSKADASRVAHRLLGNEWLAMVSAEAVGRGAEVLDAWAEGGSSLRSDWKAVEPDGVVRLRGAGGRRLAAYLEVDMGTQREAAVRAKVEAYGRYLVGATDFGRDPASPGRLPLVVFFCKTEARSETVLAYVIAELKRPLYGSTRDSLRELGVVFDDVFLVANLEWAFAGGALGESCVAAGTDEFCSVLDLPYLARETHRR